MFANIRQPYPRPRHATPIVIPPPPPGAASSMAVVGSSSVLHSLVLPGAPPPPPPTLAQLQHQQQRPLYARQPVAATVQNAQAYHAYPSMPFAAQRPLRHPPASRQVVDALCDKLLQDPHFFHSVMDLASRRGFPLHVPAAPASSSTPVASVFKDPSSSAVGQSFVLSMDQRKG